MHPYPQAKPPAGDTVPEAWDAATDLQVEAQTNKLDGQQDERHRREDEESNDKTQPDDQGITGRRSREPGSASLALLERNAVEFEAVVHQLEAVLSRDALLQGLDFR